jgi:hypothetical protein
VIGGDPLLALGTLFGPIVEEERALVHILSSHVDEYLIIEKK